MPIPIWLSVAFFLVGVGCVGRANVLFSAVVADVNQRLPQEHRFVYLGSGRQRFFEIVVRVQKALSGRESSS